MMTSVLTSREELDDFLSEVEDRCGDAAGSTCLLFVRWCEGPVPGADVVARWNVDPPALLLEVVDVDGARAIPLEVSIEGPIVVDGRLMGFHVRKICEGVWALAPSLNIPGVMHGYIVLHGVPDPAPWERLVILATSF